MISLYAWPTPNAYKISIMLEEIGFAYDVIPVNIMEGAQFAPDFLKISPNNRMPAMVDSDAPNAPVSIFESGAILMYLAEKSGKFWPTEPSARYQVAQWVMWQMSGFGPMLGQAGHFIKFADEKIPYAIARYTRETKRLFGVLDRQLQDKEYIATDYSIADMACYPWSLISSWMDLSIHEFSAVQRWQATMAARPAVARGMALLAEKRVEPKMDEQAREVLYGKRQLEQR